MPSYLQSIVAIDGFGNAGGHTTLWNGESKEFEDSKIKRISYEKDSIGNAILRMC